MTAPVPRSSDRLLAACLVLAPITALAGAAIGYQGSPEAGLEAEVAWMSGNAARAVASNALWLWGSLLFVPVAIGLLRLVPARLHLAGLASASLLVVGAFFHGAVIAYSSVQVPLVEGLGVEAAQEFVAGPMYGHTAFLVVLLPFIGYYLGLLALGAILWRAGAAPAWAFGLLVLGLALGIAWNHPAKNEAMFALFAVALAPLALRLWRAPASPEGDDAAPGSA